jgi:hypothetical protein
VVNYDYWIRRFAAQVSAGGESLFLRRYQAFKSRPRRRERRFLSLNLTARPTKILFLLRLLADGLWDRGFISFGGFERLHQARAYGMEKIHKEIRVRCPGFADMLAELEPLLPRLDAMGPMLLRAPGAPADQNNLVFEDELAEYGRSWFSVVTESEMMDRPSRITEKPLKALLNFHPLIVLGNPGALAMIRELGFQTFPEIIDESYDEEPDPRRRFDMAYRQIERLSRMDEAELDRLEAKVADKLRFNAQFGSSWLVRRFRDQIDPAVLDALAPQLNPPAPPSSR